MIVILESTTSTDSEEHREVLDYLTRLPGIEIRMHRIPGDEQNLTEIYLIGDTARLAADEIAALPGVERVVRISEEYRILGRHKDDLRYNSFEYNGVLFSQDTLNFFIGLGVVDSPRTVEAVVQALQAHGQVCTRMGVYKSRTSPYSFQGYGKECLPYVLELAGKHGIRVVAMEITHEKHIEELHECLESTGYPTGVMVQIGTHNTQNFELLKAVGRQQEFPVLFKRGFGITLNESLNAAEYLASEGNSQVVFCLQGVKTHLGEPHRNMVDFAQVPVVKRLTRMPVSIDPSNAVGLRGQAPGNGIFDIMHAAAQGIVAGANMVVTDFHPSPGQALEGGPQSLYIRDLQWFLDDIALVRECYEKRKRLAEKQELMPAEHSN